MGGERCLIDEDSGLAFRVLGDELERAPKLRRATIWVAVVNRVSRPHGNAPQPLRLGPSDVHSKRRSVIIPDLPSVPTAVRWAYAKSTSKTAIANHSGSTSGFFFQLVSSAAFPPREHARLKRSHTLVCTSHCMHKGLARGSTPQRPLVNERLRLSLADRRAAPRRE